jgi:hypothetical protein
MFQPRTVLPTHLEEVGQVRGHGTVCDRSGERAWSCVCIGSRETVLGSLHSMPQQREKAGDGGKPCAKRGSGEESIL